MTGNSKAQVLSHFLTMWFGSEKNSSQAETASEQSVRKRRKTLFQIRISLSSKPKCLKRKCDYAKNGRDSSLIV